MKAKAALLFLYVGPGCFAAHQAVDADPAKLIGTKFQDFLQSYPDECKKVQLLGRGSSYIATFDRADGLPVYRCVIRHKGQSVVPGYADKVIGEALYISRGVIFEVDLEVDSTNVLTHIHGQYGLSDGERHPREFEDHSGFGVIDYSVGNYNARTDSFGSSYSTLTIWRRCGLAIVYDFSALHPFSGLGSFHQTVIFGISDVPLPGCVLAH
jgi:hypothetical protein